MDAELKTKWVEALRSGKYRQAKSILRNKDGAFCCLGVLCDVSGRSLNISDDGMTINGDGYFPVWSIVGERHGRHLAEQNDRGSSFAQIADYIEKHL